jgi:DNA-binding CsgD family transcriptional regulator
VANTTLVGRRGEFERLGNVLRGDPDTAQVAVITGDAGIGMTRLLAEVAPAAPNTLVLAGACLPLSEALPYGAVTDALTGLAGKAGRSVLDRALARCAPYVRTQMSALIPVLADEPSGSSNRGNDRVRLFAAVRDLLGALGAERHTALVVEDLHWADLGTLDLLTYLVRGLAPGTALVATSRSDELLATNPALDWVATTSRLPNVESVTLAPLSRENVADLVASLVDRDRGAAFVDDVVRRGAGNPFFTEQLVAAAGDAGPRLPSAGPPPAVAQMLLGRVRAVSATASDVSAALAVAARPLTEAELVGCVDVDVTTGLRELVAVRLVEHAPQDRYRLRHALLEETVRSTLLTSLRVRLHRKVAGALAARSDEPPGEIAAHWARAGDAVEEARWSVAAARHADSLFAWHEAAAFWQRVWELWGSLADDERPDVALPDVVVACVADANRVADEADFESLLRAALADDRVISDDHATAQLLTLKAHRIGSRDQTAALTTLERALSLFDRAGRPSVQHAHALRAFVRVKRLDGATTGREEAELARAADLAEQLGASDILLEMAASRAGEQIQAGYVAAGLAELERALAQAQPASVDESILWSYVALSDAYLWLLRLEDAVDAGRHGIARALAGGNQESELFTWLVTNSVEAQLLSGNPDPAEALLSGDRTPTVTRHGWPLEVSRADLGVLRGDLTAAAERIAHLPERHNPETQLWCAAVGAEIDLWIGRPDAAKDALDAVWQLVQGAPDVVRASRALALAARAAADSAAVHASTSERGPWGRALVAKADEAACFTPHPARVLGVAFGATFSGELARLERNGEESAWRTAKDVWAGHHVPHHAGYAGWRLAECLLTAGRRKDAEAELNAAYAAAATHVPLRREIENLAKRARLSLQPPGSASAVSVSAAAAGDTRHGLTVRELEVLRLLGTGATNAEIGRQLYMSPKTASVHVSAILRKLGVRGRVQAATVAERMGLLDHD